MPHPFLQLIPHQSARYDTPQAFTYPIDQQTDIITPLDVSMYDNRATERCCESCRCNCGGGCCGFFDTGQRYMLGTDQLQYHHHRLTEALNRVYETATTSEASFDSGMTIDEESLAPNPVAAAVAAPSLRLLENSPAHRTSEQIREGNRQAFLEDIDDDPGKYFTSHTEEEEELDFANTGVFAIQDASDSMDVTPGLSSSHLSRLSLYSSYFHHGGNNSNRDLAGVGTCVGETGAFLPLAPPERR